MVHLGFIFYNTVSILVTIIRDTLPIDTCSINNILHYRYRWIAFEYITKIIKKNFNYQYILIKFQLNNF